MGEGRVERGAGGWKSLAEKLTKEEPYELRWRYKGEMQGAFLVIKIS